MAENQWTLNRVGRHLLFWSVYHLLNTAVFGYFYESYSEVFFSDLEILPQKMLISYLTIYWLIPKFILRKKKYVQFFLYYLAISVLITAVSNFFRFYGSPDYDFYNPYLVMKYIIYSYPVVGLVVAIKFWNYWYQNQLVHERLQKEKFEAELKMLKSQIHPHFLFNTINNIYSLSMENSEDAPRALLKLSEILNYILYECNVDQVSLQKEIDLLKNYLSLEKIRYEDRLDVLFNIKGKVENVKVAPLIFLTFLENSFKHGIGQTVSDAWVSIDMEITAESLTVKIENSKDEQSDKNNNQLNGGIGLKNVRRRLDMLYPDRFNLEICDDRNSFLVILKIDLVSTSEGVTS